MSEQKMSVGLVRIGSISRLLFIAIATLGIYFAASVQSAFAAPAPPSNVLANCSDDSTSVTISWDPVPLATYYIFRLDYTPNNSPACTDGWWCATYDVAVPLGNVTSTTHSVVPGQPYRSWVHAADDTSSSTSTLINFTCYVRGTLEYCQDKNPNPENCIVAGTDAYCSIDSNNVKAECTAGNETWCSYHITDASCPGSLAYCAIDANKNQPICIVGTDAYCAHPKNLGSFDCTADSFAYCARHTSEPACIPAGCTPQALGPTSTITRTFTSEVAGNGSVDLTIPLIGTVDTASPLIDVLHISLNGTEIFTGSFSASYQIIHYNPNGATASKNQTGNTLILNVQLPLIGLVAGNNTLTYTYDSPAVWQGVPQYGTQGLVDEGWCITAQNITTVDAPYVGSPEYCGLDEHKEEEICIKGTEAYCDYPLNEGTTHCTPKSYAYCEYHDDPECVPAPTNLNIVCAADDKSVTISWNAVAGADNYMARLDYVPNNAPNCINGWNCDNSDQYNNNVAASPIMFGIQPKTSYRAWVHAVSGDSTSAATERTSFTCDTICDASPHDISCEGSDSYCTDPAHPEHATEDVCKAGNDVWCRAHADDISCPGSPAYCGLHIGHVSCPGSDAYCAVPENSEDVLCPGSPAYCNVDANKNHVKCPGSPNWCALPENKASELCPGSLAYCAKPEHDNDVSCPGTVSYCEANPYDPLCGIIGEPGHSDGSTPYSVYETSKSTGLGTVLCNGIYYIKSSLGMPLAILCVVGIGLLAIFGEISWRKAAIATAGISAVFGASLLSTYMGTDVSGNIPGDNEAVLKCLTGDE